MDADPEAGHAAPERELDEAARIRRQRDLNATMNERLERLHDLCSQASRLRDEAPHSA